MVSKTIGGQLSCRFDPDLRQYELMAGWCSGITTDLNASILRRILGKIPLNFTKS
jgi:hypothetical protein